MTNPKTSSLIAVRLLLAALATGVGIARADIEVRAYANANPGHAGVVYITSGGLVDATEQDGGAIHFEPDSAAGHLYFSATATAGTNSAFSIADTARGLLHSYAAGRGAVCQTTAIIDDKLTFFNPGSQPVPITIHWTIEGTLSVSSPPDQDASAFYDCGFRFGGNNGYPGGIVHVQGQRIVLTPEQNYDIREVQDSWSQGGSSYEIVPNGSSTIFTGHLLLPPGETPLIVYQGLNLTGRGLGTGIGVADFGNTVGLALEVPPGVSFTSQSGALLNAGSRMVNIATRADILSGDNVVIGGFIVTGSVPKKVIIRGIGPSLAAVGVAGALADTTLELRQNQTLLASNDNWRDTQETEIQATGIPPGNDLESAIVRTLDPGSYTATLRGKNNATGIGLIEVYDLQASVDSKLANISTRALIEAGDNVMIGGIIGGGNGSQPKVLIRAIGPSLTPLGVANALQDPLLELHDNNGALIASNNDWQSDQQAEIQATGLAPTNAHESAILATLLPTNYTAIVKGVNNTSGVGLVEVYHLQ
jgi:hypothetical protein